MKMPTLVNSKGEDSTTMLMVCVAFCAVVFRFMVPESWGYESMTGVEFAAALAAVGAMHLWRRSQD